MESQNRQSPQPPKSTSKIKNWFVGLGLLLALGSACDETRPSLSYADQVIRDSINTTIGWTWAGR